MQSGMRSRICICCGEPMAEHGNALSRNPNLCASCSSLNDGMGDSGPPGLGDVSNVEPPLVQSAVATTLPNRQEQALETDSARQGRP
jgi:hypothetical protein